MSAETLCEQLDAAMASGGSGLNAADELCRACVEILGVDGAAISVVQDGSSRGTFGSSGDVSRRLDELQFTYGEGPCLDAVSSHESVLVPDLTDLSEQRWPALTRSLLDGGIHAIFAAPVAIASAPIGALDLFRETTGALTPERLTAFLHAADLAAMPLLDLMGSNLDWPAAADHSEDGAWLELASLERVEVYQATGMIMGQLDIDPAEALVRLRAHAFANNQTASEAAWAVISRRVSFRAQTGSNS